MQQNILIAVLYILGFHCVLCAQPEKAKFEKDIVSGDYLVRLENIESEFFTGKVTVYNLKISKQLFEAEGFFTDYKSDTLMDLDNNGHTEIILDLGTGATMYDYNMLLIFDFSDETASASEVHNAALVYIPDEMPKIISEIRLSPNYLGAGYSFSLKYENGRLIPESAAGNRLLRKELDFTEENIKEIMTEYVKETGECSGESQVQVYYEAYITQKKILGEEKKGWSFFDRNYKCKDKKRVRTALKKIVSVNYNNLMNYENYIFQKNH